MTATYQTRGDVAVITLANPPVNGLGYETRLGIVNGLEQALNDAAVIKHKDLICECHSAEPMRNCNGCPTAHRALERLLRFAVQS